MRRFLLGLLLVLAVRPLQAQAGDSLTVPGAVARALAAYPSVEAARAAVDAAQARLRGTERTLLPTLDAVARYTRQDPVPEFAVPTAGGTVRTAIQPNNLYDAHAEASWTVLDFGRQKAAEAQARAGVEAAEAQLGAVREALALGTAQSLLRARYVDAALRAQDAQIADLRAALDVTERRRAAGVVTDYEVLATQTRIAQAEAQRLDLVRAAEAERAVLRQLLGLDAEAPVAVATRETDPISAFDAAGLVARALAQRAEVRAAEAQARAAGASIRVVRSNDRPSVAVSGQAGVRNGYPGELNTLKVNTSATVGLRVPILDGGRTAARVQEAQALAAQAEARLAEQRLAVTAEVQRAVADVRASQGRIDAAAQAEAQARQALDLALVRYRAGTLTNLDLLDAETNLGNIRLLRLSAERDAATARLALDRATGTLAPMF